MPASMRKREIVLSHLAAKYFLRLGPGLRWKILEDLDRLASDLYLQDLREEDGENFIISNGYLVFVEIDAESVQILSLRMYLPN